jgi:DNA replication protein DnaC
VWQLLKRLDAEGKNIFAMDAARFGNELAKRFEDKTWFDWLEQQGTKDVWFLDDLDKTSFTERVQREIFSLTKMRGELNLPTIFTTNLVGDGLLDPKIFGREIGAALVRRIREDFENVPFI